jgi:LysM repeat protein
MPLFSGIIFTVHTKYILNKPLASILAAALLLALAFGPASPASAQAGTASELINTVNAYRASVGLAPYEIDGGLMTLAQSHSEYQASIQTCTHQRADGSGPGVGSENIACGNNLTVDGAVYRIWSDALHTATMLGPDTGQVGAGVAVAGDTVYYTLDVRSISGDFSYSPPAQASNQDSSSTSSGTGGIEPVLFQDQFATNTPNADGSISHIVKYGETLVGIAEAYGIQLNDLISMNKLDPVKPVIFENQALLIRLAFTATPFMTATYTPRPPTRTPMPTRTPRPTRTPTVFHTPLPTGTATREPLVKVPSIESLGPIRPILAYAFIGISAIGLVVLILTSFLPGKK